jgi:hypothetical protein
MMGLLCYCSAVFVTMEKVLINMGDRNNKIFQNNEVLKKGYVYPCVYVA